MRVLGSFSFHLNNFGILKQRMEKKYLHIEKTFIVLITVLMICHRIEGYPYKWPRFYSSSADTRDTRVALSSSHINSHELIDDHSSSETRVITSVLNSSKRDEQEKNVTENSEIMRNSKNQREIDFKSVNDDNDETESLLEEAFRILSLSETEEPINKPIIRMPVDNTDFRRFDYKQGNAPASVISHDMRDRIIFPDDSEPTGAKKLSRVPVCHDTTFCEDTPYYPTELVDLALRSNTNLKYLETVDELEPPVIGERISDDDDALCISKEDVVKPRTALNKDNKWLYVLNNENFTQAVRVEVCKTQNSPCEVIDGFADGYTTTCKQKYIYRQLIALVSDGSIGPDSFQIPASCCCHVKFTGNPLLRMGINLKKDDVSTPKDRGI